MNLYRISQTLNNDYDTYDSIVVCAKSKKDARQIHPSSFITHITEGKWMGTKAYPPYEEYLMDEDAGWVKLSETDQIEVEYLGKAAKNMKRGLILASYNAG